MLIIREEQMQVFSKYMLQQFEDKMVKHLTSLFPEQTAEMAESDLRAMIQEGIEMAEQYGIIDEVDIERYLECMVIYGRDFDTNPATSWSGSILTDPYLTGTEKMNQINENELVIGATYYR